MQNPYHDMKQTLIILSFSSIALHFFYTPSFAQHNFIPIYADSAAFLEDVERYSEILPLAQALQSEYKKLDATKNNLDKASIYNVLARGFFFSDQIDSSLFYANAALDILKSEDKPTKIQLAKAYKTIGEYYRLKTDLDKSFQYAERALNTILLVLEPDHSNVGEFYHVMAKVHAGKFEFETALNYAQKASQAYLSLYGPFHVKIMYIYLHTSIQLSRIGTVIPKG